MSSFPRRPYRATRRGVTPPSDNAVIEFHQSDSPEPPFVPDHASMSEDDHDSSPPSDNAVAHSHQSDPELPFVHDDRASMSKDDHDHGRSPTSMSMSSSGIIFPPSGPHGVEAAANLLDAVPMAFLAAHHGMSDSVRIYAPFN